MKLKNFLLMGSLSIFTLASCVSNDDNSEWNDGSQAIKFTSSIKGLSTRAAGTEWATNDQVGIFMKASDKELSAATAPNKLHTTDAQGNLSASGSTNALYYPTDGSSVDFVAYYPYTTSLDGITYKVDVTTQADLLYSNNAKGFAKTASTNPQLQFAHMLSQIVFNIEKDATIPSLTGLKVTFKGMNTKADFALADGTLSNAGTVADIVGTVDGTVATTIVLPATTLSGVQVTFDLNGKSFTADYPQTVLDEGRKYVHKVSLSDSNGQPVITMDAAKITDWTEVPGDNIDVDFGEGIITPPSDEVVVTESAPYTEAFTTGQGKFTIEDVTVPSELVNGVWVSDPQYGMKASAYAGATYASESWLVSPILDLTGATKATLTFQHAINQTKDANFTTYYDLLAKKEGDATWTALTMTFPATESWTFVSGGDIDLSTYAGGKVQFAFKYTSTATNAGTWEIKDLKVTVGEGGGDTPPDVEDEDEDGIFIEEGFGDPEANTKIGAYEGWVDSSVTYADATGNCDVRKTTTMNGHVWLPANKDGALKISGFNTSGYTTLQLTYDITANGAIDQNVITIVTDKGAVVVPSKTVAQNTYQTVTLTLPDGITYVQFTSTATTNTKGFRLDNVKLVGTSK